MTKQTKRSLLTVVLLAFGVTAVIMSLTIVGMIGRANAQVPGELPENPTSLFVDLYRFIKNGAHLPAVGAGLMLLVWFLRWSHAKLPAPVGPFFKTRLGGYVLGFGTALSVYLGTALMADQPWTFDLFFQAIGVGFAAAGSWEGLMDVLRKKNSAAKATTTALLVVILVSPVLVGCRYVKKEAREVGGDVVDCTKGELSDLGGLIPVLLPSLGESPDWKVVAAQLEQAGGRVGSCVLAMLVDRWKSNLKLATPDGSRMADQALDEFKAKFRVAVIKTSSGVR